MNKHKRLFLFLFFLVLVSGAVFLLYRANAHKGANVILISVDSLRPDHLGCYGYKRNTSPHIDNLGREGAIFTQAISQGASTIPSVPSIMTSLYPHQRGVMTIYARSALTRPTLAGILAKNGYQTGAVVAHPLLHTGVGAGFDFVDFCPSVDATVVTKKASQWIKRNRNKNFFLWIHYNDSHVPYKVPSPYNELFLPEEFKGLGPEVLLKKYQKKNVFEFQHMPDLTDEGKDYYISQYDGGIRFVDDQIGVLMKNLEKSRLEERTLIILIADHGENLADYDKSFFHGSKLYDVLLKVPLIIKGNIIPKGKVIKQQVQLIDIMPTVLDALKIKTNLKMEGASLLPLVLGEEKAGSQYAFSECLYKDSVMRSIRTEGWKLIFYAFLNLEEGRYRWELFNLKKDPKESLNVVQSEQKVFRSLKAKLTDWMQRTEKNPAKDKVRPLNEETLNKLRNLGYVQ